MTIKQREYESAIQKVQIKNNIKKEIKDKNWEMKDEEIKEEINKLTYTYKTRIELIKQFIWSKLSFLTIIFPPTEPHINKITK